MLNFNWIVLGPLRSGSKLVVDIITNIYIQNIIHLQYFNPATNAESVLNWSKSNWILHSHSPKVVKDIILNSDRSKLKIILTSRDVIAASLSRCILDQTNIYHMYLGYPKTFITIKPFKLDIERYKLFYNEHQNVFAEVQNYDIDVDYKLDYDSYENDPFLIAKYLEMENFMKRKFTRNIPLKNPGTYDQWFINWDDIKSRLNIYCS